jgi:hypothetical protein
MDRFRGQFDLAKLYTKPRSLQTSTPHDSPSGYPTKALLRILIAELRVNSRSEVLPTYRVGTPVVCAQTSSVGETARRANHPLVMAPAIGIG